MSRRSVCDKGESTALLIGVARETLALLGGSSNNQASKVS